MSNESVGHAFISYVREDSDAVARIRSALGAADVPVWTDKTKLTPGEDWKVTIRRAIQKNALAFIAVFSANSQARGASYQNEELVLAVDQFRTQPPGRIWLLPVRLDDCSLPEFDLGAGRTLDSLQRVDLFGEDAEDEKIRLVSAVLRLLNDQNTDSATVKALVSQDDQEHRGETLAKAVKAMVLDPRRRIELDDLVLSEAKMTRDALVDETIFPSSIPPEADVSFARRMVERYQRYWSTVKPLSQALVAGCAWVESTQTSPWTQAVRAVASIVDGPQSGNTYLLAMKRFPLTALVYAAALAAVARKNFPALKAVAVDAVVRRQSGERIPVVNSMQTYEYEERFKPAAHLFALTVEGVEASDEDIDGWVKRNGMRFTPISDSLHALLRPLLEPVVPDDAEYDDLFDEVEVLLAVLATDGCLQAKSASYYVGNGWYGRFTWKERRSPNPIHRRMSAECVAAGDAWEPLKAGLFGGSSERAKAAFDAFVQDADRVINQRW
jgi:hypothetical protein